jgi:RNA polymerase sigma-70 factor (ECF subfamily)
MPAGGALATERPAPPVAQDRDETARVVSACLEDVADRARAGDREAFGELVRSTYRSMYALALRITGDVHEASDALQEAYLRAFKGFQRFRGESDVRSWLYRVTANTALTHRQRRGREMERLSSEVVEWADDSVRGDPQASVSLRDELVRLQKAIAHLPPQLRHALVLRELHGWSHEEVARELGISVAAARVRVLRARRKLGEWLGATATPGEPPER